MEDLKKIIRDMMLEDLITQGEKVKNQIEMIEHQVVDTLNDIEDFNFNRVYIVGCGDSYYVGHAVRMAFEQYAGISTEPIESFEFNKYMKPFVEKKALMVGVSISGQVGTSLDAIRTAAEKGLFTIGLNATPGSRIYSVANKVIDIGVRVREPGPVPQTYHYLANMVALYLIAMGLGARRGVISQIEYESLKSEIIYNLEAVRENAVTLKDKVFNYTRDIVDKAPFVIIGEGPNYSTALFGVAKLIEAAVTSGISQETEEWAHEQYFITRPGVVSIVIANKGAGYERSMDILKSIKKLGGTAIAITTDVDEQINKIADDVWNVKVVDNEILSPMMTKLPLEIFSYSIAEHLDIRPFNYDNEIRKKTCEETIYINGVSAEAVARKNCK